MNTKTNLLAFVLAGGLTVAPTYGQTTFTTDGVNYEVTSAENRTVEIAASSCYDVAGGVFAPTTVRNDDTDYTITNIVDYAFNRCTNLISITLPNSVTSIGTGAFQRCTNLVSITLPNTITSIAQDTFQHCTSLANLDLPNTLESIGTTAFNSCTNLRNITLPKSIMSIGGNAFWNCSNLTIVAINKTTPIVITPGVFQNVAIDMFTLKIPTGSKAAYQKINAAVWRTFGTITEIDFEFEEAGINYVVTNTETPTIAIAEGSCYTENSGVFAVTEVVNASITYAITSIATAAFEDCTGLTGFTFPSTVTCVSSATFKGCTGLATVTLPNSIREIGNNAFENCTGLEAFTINKVVPLIINANVFLGASITTATLNVPTAGVSAYKIAPVWSGFSTTQTLNTESHVKEKAFSISINNGFLEITQADRALKINRVQIINLLGQVVKTSKENSIALSNLPVGFYIVSIYTKNGRFSRKFVRE